MKSIPWIPSLELYNANRYSDHSRNESKCIKHLDFTYLFKTICTLIIFNKKRKLSISFRTSAGKDSTFGAGRNEKRKRDRKDLRENKRKIGPNYDVREYTEGICYLMNWLMIFYQHHQNWLMIFYRHHQENDEVKSEPYHRLKNPTGDGYHPLFRRDRGSDTQATATETEKHTTTNKERRQPKILV